ncbi:MAG: LysM peptidoglycan-binding domain-containing protein [Firmicutes bacterium]|nr:LysM peptidoglycan-binding domain-containing protein [Bacillota bacterium]
MEYLIQPGDTLYAISRRYGITVDQLLAANPQVTNLDTNQEILSAGAADNYSPGWNSVTCPPCQTGNTPSQG